MINKLRSLLLIPILLLYRFSSNTAKLTIREDLESYSQHYSMSGVGIPNNIYLRLLFVFINSRSFRVLNTIIGNNVVIGLIAIIVAFKTTANNKSIGANSYVDKDIPNNCRKQFCEGYLQVTI